MSDVGDDGLVLETHEVFHSHHTEVSGSGNQNVNLVDESFEASHLITVHCRLEGEDGVNLRDNDASTLPTERLCRALTDVAITTNESNFAAHERIGGAVQTINK